MRLSKLILMLTVIIILTSCGLSEPIADDDRDQIKELQQTIEVLESRLAETSEAPAITEDPTEEEIESASLPISTEEVMEPTPASLPTEPVPAGEPVIYDGWALTLSPEIQAEEGFFDVSFTIRNLGDTSRVFRYQKNGISVSDDLGNKYEFLLTGNSCKQNPDNIFLTQQLTINPDASQSIHGEGDWWLNPCLTNYLFPAFDGVIPIEASQLKVTINNWGPFNGVEYYLDL